MSDEHNRRDREPDGPPASGGVDDEAEAIHDRCKSDRATLSPRETSDCAGADLAELYENEEDGGS